MHLTCWRNSSGHLNHIVLYDIACTLHRHLKVMQGQHDDVIIKSTSYRIGADKTFCKVFHWAFLYSMCMVTVQSAR